ncbi:hypothetical protein AB0C14_28880 [Microbispora hainanensis]|uniref:hypothetical protein n=1 Tax=Microbispora hainanensis TaxID=568844 RepID=UPI0033F62AFE
MAPPPAVGVGAAALGPPFGAGLLCPVGEDTDGVAAPPGLSGDGAAGGGGAEFLAWPPGSREVPEGQSALVRPDPCRLSPRVSRAARSPVVRLGTRRSWSRDWWAVRSRVGVPVVSPPVRRGAMVAWSGALAVSGEEPSRADPDEPPERPDESRPPDESCCAPDAPSEPREERREESDTLRSASDEPDEEPVEEPGPALTAVRVPEAASSGVVAASSCTPTRTPPEPPDEKSGAEFDAGSDDDEPNEEDEDDESDENAEARPGSSDVGAAMGAAPSIGGGASRPGSATAAQGCATTAPPVADTAARSRPETRVARREDIRGVIEGSSSI